MTAIDRPRASHVAACAVAITIMGCHQLDHAIAGPDGCSDCSKDAGPDGMLDAAPCCDGPSDASTHDAGQTPQGVVLYPAGARQSPMTSTVAAHLTAVVGGGTAPAVFAKVGDSMTATTDFVACFDGGYDLGTHGSLGATRSYFAGGNAAGTTPYSRVSSAATGGWETRDVLTGAPTPLQQEETALSPRYAFVLLGTNDNRYGRAVDAFGQDLWTIIDDLLAGGTIPVMSTIAPVNGDTSTDARVPLFNDVIRAIAQGRQVPLVDLHDQLVPLPNRGIGSDGLHPTVSPTGACDLTANGLQYGYNVRNLISLEALDRTRAALDGHPPDASAQLRGGDGSHAHPYIGGWPLVDLADTRTGDSSFSTYSCDSTAHNGRENIYKLTLSAATTIDAYVIDRGSVDVDVHILNGSLSASACVASGDTMATATVGPGTVYIAVDALASSTEGEYVLVVEPH